MDDCRNSFHGLEYKTVPSWVISRYLNGKKWKEKWRWLLCADLRSSLRAVHRGSGSFLPGLFNVFRPTLRLWILPWKELKNLPFQRILVSVISVTFSVEIIVIVACYLSILTSRKRTCANEQPCWLDLVSLWVSRVSDAWHIHVSLDWTLHQVCIATGDRVHHNIVLLV